jgi:hypothetical protein
MPTVTYLCKLLIEGYLGIIHGVEQDEKLDLRTVAGSAKAEHSRCFFFNTSTRTWTIGIPLLQMVSPSIVMSSFSTTGGL